MECLFSPLANDGVDHSAGGDDAKANLAKTEITSTFTNKDAWKNPKVNFLLRLISDDKKRGYCGRWDIYKPHVQLALAFVRQMSQYPEFTDFIQSTVDVQGHHEESVEVSDETHQNAGSSNTHSDVGRDEKKRGNGILHEAAKYGQCRYLEQFLSTANLNARNNIGETALHLAAEFEQSRNVETLLRSGAIIKVTLSRLCHKCRPAAVAAGGLVKCWWCFFMISFFLFFAA